MAQTPQTFANHTRFDPLFHFFLVPVFMAAFVSSIVHLVRFPSFASGWYVILCVAAVLTLLKMRLYGLKLQDRIIRLEERLRLLSLVDETLRLRISELSERQLVALRFASDAEVPGLMKRALAENLSGKDIKKAVQSWRPDYWRV